MPLRFSDEHWNTLDAKLESIKRQQLNFGFVIVLVIISVFLYFCILECYTLIKKRTNLMLQVLTTQF